MKEMFAVLVFLVVFVLGFLVANGVDFGFDKDTFTVAFLAALVVLFISTAKK
jgi:hypothetical protein